MTTLYKIKNHLKSHPDVGYFSLRHKINLNNKLENGVNHDVHVIVSPNVEIQRQLAELTPDRDSKILEKAYGWSDDNRIIVIPRLNSPGLEEFLGHLNGFMDNLVPPETSPKKKDQSKIDKYRVSERRYSFGLYFGKIFFSEEAGDIEEKLITILENDLQKLSSDEELVANFRQNNDKNYCSKKSLLRKITIHTFPNSGVAKALDALVWFPYSNGESSYKHERLTDEYIDVEDLIACQRNVENSKEFMKSMILKLSQTHIDDVQDSVDHALNGGYLWHMNQSKLQNVQENDAKIRKLVDIIFN